MSIPADKFLTKEQIREHLNLPSTRMVEPVTYEAATLARKVATLAYSWGVP